MQQILKPEKTEGIGENEESKWGRRGDQTIPIYIISHISRMCPLATKIETNTGHRWPYHKRQGSPRHEDGGAPETMVSSPRRRKSSMHAAMGNSMVNQNRRKNSLAPLGENNETLPKIV